MSQRVAIIGAGPRALHALARLSRHVTGAHPGLRVDVFDTATPGAGPAYEPALDPALLMNIRAELVDAWPRDGAAGVPRCAARPDFVQWTAAAHEPVGADDYAPRALVGRYLHDAWQRVLAGAPPAVDIALHRVLVHRVASDGDHWRIDASAGSWTVDEVLLATGHGAPAADPRALPLDELAGLGVIAADGAGLTAIDLVRGLAARRAATGSAVRVHLVSRTGRPPLPKPVPGVDRAWRTLLDERRGGHRPRLDELTTIRRTLLGDAAALLGDGDAAAEALRYAEARTPASQSEVLRELDELITATSREAPVDPRLALGAAWRWRYPQLVADAGYGGLASGDRPGFLALAAALEPVAFGPPVDAAITLRDALADGWVHLHGAPAWIERDPRGGGVLHAARGENPVDVVVRARQLAPGIDNSPLTAALAHRGIISAAPGGRGARVAPDGTAIAADGSPQPGLALIGRATEDWVIGNDTLDPALNDLAAAWARRVASGARERARTKAAR